ncbi:MAG: signal recognition particle-docking protein FtsY [Oscillospiraceae bacterium]|nr:signal recognition particle-docking protein FtsY [Oscillospiraceae bacterium]
MGFFANLGKGLKKTRDSLVKQIEQAASGFGKIDEDLFEEITDILIMADIGVSTSEKIVDMLRGQVKEKGISDPAEIRGLLKEILAGMLAGGEELDLSTKPAVVLVIGVNGVGKTTTIGKLAAKFTGEGKKVLLGAADTFRAAAIEQLEVWADRAGCSLVKHAEGSDPAAVVFDTITAGKARGVDVIICDTAGRLHNKKNLMDELAKITRVVGREAEGCAMEFLLVVDASTGQNGVNQAKLFSEAAGSITGIVLTKLDGTAKGGVVVAIKDQLGIPVKFIGVGEGVDDLRPFDPNEFVEALFDGEDGE